jgi:integrase
MSLALCTAMRGCEIKRLQWRDIDFLGRTILVRRSKTEAGQRLIPMNDEALEIVMHLRDCAKAFSGIESHHYVFSACEHGQIDPTKNQKSFRTAWRSMTGVVRCPVCDKSQRPANICSNQECKTEIRGIKSPLAGLRFHDLRHQAITELAESQVSDQTIMAIAGHVSQKMLARYPHVRSEARKQAVAVLSARPAGTSFRASKNTSYDTNRDTKQDHMETPATEVIVSDLGHR